VIPLPGQHASVAKARRKKTASIDAQFDYVAAASEWADEHAGELISGDLTESQRRAISTQIKRAIARGDTQEQAAKRIRPLIGLSERDALAVSNLESSLRNQGKSERQVRRDVNGYSRRLHNQRANLVAAHEIARAYAEGKRREWEQARREGVLSRNAVRVYHCHRDDRTCASCLANDGVRTKVGSVGPTPPLHPRCRCWETVEDPAPPKSTKPKKLDRFGPFPKAPGKKLERFGPFPKAPSPEPALVRFGPFPKAVSKSRVVVPPYRRADGTWVEGYSYERKRRRRALSKSEFQTELARVLPGLNGTLSQNVAREDPANEKGYSVERTKRPIVRVTEDVALTDYERGVVLERLTEMALRYPETASNVVSISFVTEKSINAAASTGLTSVLDSPGFDDQEQRLGIHYNFSVDAFRNWPSPTIVNSYWPRQERQMDTTEVRALRETGGTLFDNEDDVAARISELIVHEWTHGRHFVTIAKRLSERADGKRNAPPMQRAFRMMRNDADLFTTLLYGRHDQQLSQRLLSALSQTNLQGLPASGLMSEAREVSKYATANVAEAVAEAATLEYVMPKADGFRRRVVPGLTEAVESLAKSGLQVLPDGSVGIACQLGTGHSHDLVEKTRVVVPPYRKADGTWVEGYSYERRRRRSGSPTKRRIRRPAKVGTVGDVISEAVAEARAQLPDEGEWFVGGVAANSFNPEDDRQLDVIINLGKVIDEQLSKATESDKLERERLLEDHRATLKAFEARRGQLRDKLVELAAPQIASTFGEPVEDLNLILGAYVTDEGDIDHDAFLATTKNWKAIIQHDGSQLRVIKYSKKDRSNDLSVAQFKKIKDNGAGKPRGWSRHSWEPSEPEAAAWDELRSGREKEIEIAKEWGDLIAKPRNFSASWVNVMGLGPVDPDDIVPLDDRYSDPEFVADALKVVPERMRRWVRTVVWDQTWQWEDGRGRSHYENYAHSGRPELGRIGLANRNAGSVVHEFFHHVEVQDKDVGRATWAFRERRTSGEELVQMESLVPLGGYRPDEITKPDKFFDPYAGVHYPNSHLRNGAHATEILTMGVQAVLWSNSKPEPDQEYRAFVLGLLALKG
jgi:hypothetical protein